MELLAGTTEEVAPPLNLCGQFHETRQQFLQELSPERKPRRAASYEQLPTAKHESDLGLPQSIEPQQKEEEEEDDYEVKCRESFKRVFRSVHASSHPEALDPNSPDFDQKVNKLIESVINPCDDEVIKVPQKRHWMDICLGIWGLKDDDAVISQVKASKQVFEIYTDGLYNDDRDSGCGAILHDCHGRPIVARSKVIPKGKCVSPFYLQLEGVALGIKLAEKYNPFPFYLYCQSASVCEFVMQNWKRKDMCICSGNWESVTIRCKACSKRFMFTQDQKDHEQAFELTKDNFSDIHP
ncbi:hypothetical protein MKX03_031069 [Papaver bracteatum]|nr:hypothetical protein MKX03_031069 [Papaver bracteatum]